MNGVREIRKQENGLEKGEMILKETEKWKFGNDGRERAADRYDGVSLIQTVEAGNL